MFSRDIYDLLDAKQVYPEAIAVLPRRLNRNVRDFLALYSNESYPFDPPKTGKIAVKVINHYGDEVMKVYPV